MTLDSHSTAPASPKRDGFFSSWKPASVLTAVTGTVHRPRLSRSHIILLLAGSCLTLSAATLSAQNSASAASAAPASSAPAASLAGSPITAEAMLYPGEDFQLGPGDLISLHVFLQSDYVATTRIDADGNVNLPLIGSVNLKGLTVREAQALIADRLESGGFYAHPEVIMQVLDTVNGTALVTGEMHANVPVASERSLKDILLTAGGLPPTASHTVKIVRAGLPDPIVVELGTDLAASQTANIAVHPHDIIQISRASVVYVLGAFARQGSVALDQSSPLTLLQLAALSGGVGFEARNSGLSIVRTVGTDRKVIQVDLKKIRDGKSPDPVLQANDIVFLPTDKMKAAIKSVGTGGVFAIVSLLYTAHAF
ncbi:MAG TPA: polysaccharide biosynthesis/export family protein [Acidobacteriaceae bacterium]|nr:polysaccharide biosynthesis/export family protein [Acidobacteriaceae bacterium]